MFAFLKSPPAKPYLPWYKNYMIVLFVIGLPLVMVLLCIYLVYYSVENADTTVREDWYMDGKALYADASKDKLAHDLGLAASMTITPTGAVTATLDIPDTAHMPKPATLALDISHATEKDKDRDIKLTRAANGNYTGNVSLAAGLGKYYLVIHDEPNTWRLRNVSKLPSSDTLAFKPLTAFDENVKNPNPNKPSDVKIDERKQQN